MTMLYKYKVENNAVWSIFIYEPFYVKIWTEKESIFLPKEWFENYGILKW